MKPTETSSCKPRLRCQTEASMSRPSQTESTYVQTVPDGSCLCPDFRAFMSRLSCVRQTFVRSCSDFRAFMSRLSCVRQTFVLSCSDFRAFFDVSRLCNFERTTPPSCVHLRSGHTCFRLGPQPGKEDKTYTVLLKMIVCYEGQGM